MVREDRIDLARGISLLLIFIGHSGFSFSETFQHMRGFSDAAEMFVLMAGMSSALAFYGLGVSGSWRKLAGRTTARAWKLYWIHVLLVVGIVLMTRLPIAGDLVLDGQKVSDFWTAPLDNAASVAALMYMPGLLDILPLYVVLIAALPLFFWLHRRSVLLLAGLSILVWFVTGGMKLNLTNWGSHATTWYFNPLSWQLVFAFGIALGVRVRNRQEALPYNRYVYAAALVFVVMSALVSSLFALVFTSAHDSGLFHLVASKTFVGPLRIVNAVAVLYVFWNTDLVRRAVTVPLLAPLYAAGRNSLPVFVMGLVLSMLNVFTLEELGYQGIGVEAFLLVVGILAQLTYAMACDEKRPARKAVAVPSASTLAPSG